VNNLLLLKSKINYLAAFYWEIGLKMSIEKASFLLLKKAVL